MGTVGNVSCRFGDRILITPTRVSPDRMRPEDLVLVDFEGRYGDGEMTPSIELPLHLAAYRHRSGLGAVVHTHSPHATAWSFLGERLLPVTEENRYYGVGAVRTTSAAVGSDELARCVEGADGRVAAVLLGGHGVLAFGADVEGALDVARVVERQAQIAWLLRGDRSQDGEKETTSADAPRQTGGLRS